MVDASIYFPNPLLHGLDPLEGRGRGTHSSVGWIRAALSASEANVVAAGGVDTVFQLQVDNNIPIKSWFDNPSDQELVELLPFLEGLIDAEDARAIISKTFHDKPEQI